MTQPPRSEGAARALCALTIAGFTAVIDDEWARKQPDWSYDGRWSGDWPTQEVDVRSGAGH